MADQVCRPNYLPAITPQLDRVEATLASQQQLATTSVTTQQPTTTVMPPPPLPLSSTITVSLPMPKMVAPRRNVTSMELPTTEEMEEAMVILPECSKVAIETQPETQMMRAMDISIPMDSDTSNIIPLPCQGQQVG